MTKFGFGAGEMVTAQGWGACWMQVGGFRRRRLEIESAASHTHAAPSVGVVFPAQVSVSGGVIGSMQRRPPCSLHRARSSGMRSRRPVRTRRAFRIM